MGQCVGLEIGVQRFEIHRSLLSHEVRNEVRNEDEVRKVRVSSLTHDFNRTGNFQNLRFQ